MHIGWDNAVTEWGRHMARKIDAGINAVQAIRDLLQIDDEWAG